MLLHREGWKPGTGDTITDGSRLGVLLSFIFVCLRTLFESFPEMLVLHVQTES